MENPAEEQQRDKPRGFYLNRFPRIVSHIICESLGYATPQVAAAILKDAAEGRGNYCELVASCYQGNPRTLVSDAIAHRKNHNGYMAEYENARAIVDKVNNGGNGPLLASWF